MLVSVMRSLIFVNLVLSEALALLTPKSCSHNELCIDIRKCSKFKPFNHINTKDWPEKVAIDAVHNYCNYELINGSVVWSVCCPSPMNNKDCGVLDGNRVANGNEAELFQFPWMALLIDLEKEKYVCGGTLVSSRYVLTAAHCARSKDSTLVRLGEHDINKVIDCNAIDDQIECAPMPQEIRVERIISHPKYSIRHRKNDIALLRLERPATLTYSVRPICLPSGSIDQRMNDKPYNVILTGWGLTEHGNSFDVLRFSRLSLMPLDECAPEVLKFDSAIPLDQSHICAKGMNQTNHCDGDSGGPLLYVSNHTYRGTLSGVVQFGTKTCGEGNAPGVYANVAHYLDWIAENVDE